MSKELTKEQNDIIQLSRQMQSKTSYILPLTNP